MSSSRVRVSLCSSFLLFPSCVRRARHPRTAFSCFALLALQLSARRRFSDKTRKMAQGKFAHLPLSVDGPLECPYTVCCLYQALGPQIYPSLTPRRAKMFSIHHSTTKAQPSHIENVTTLTSMASCQPTSRTSKNKSAAHMTNTYLAKTTLPRTPS